MATLPRPGNGPVTPSGGKTLSAPAVEGVALPLTSYNVSRDALRIALREPGYVPENITIIPQRNAE